MIHVDLFSGVGMFAYAMKQAGIKTVAFAEIDPWCHRVLRKHYPDAIIYDDVRKVSYEQLKKDGIISDAPRELLNGGGNAGTGRRDELADPCEDVADTGSNGLQGRGLFGSCNGTNGTQARETTTGKVVHGDADKCERSTQPRMGLLADGIAARLSRSRWLPEPGIGRVASGVPDRVNKLKALGNGLVWQIPYAIVQTILENEQ